MTPRGIRNNNPLNIRHSKDQWKGAVATQTDPAFVQFKSMAYGYRAVWKILDTYHMRFRREQRVFNVRNIIACWAPPSENDTEAYVKTVLKLSGLGGNENIPRPNRFRNFERLEKTICLIRAMTCVECGIPWKEVDVPAIWRGYDLAYPGRREMYCYPSKRTSYSAVDETEEQDEEEHEPTDEELEDARKPPVWDEYWDWSTSL